MQRIWRFLAAFFGAAVLAMLWFWLVFGLQDMACGGVQRSAFLEGRLQFGALAALWGALAALLAGPRRRSTLALLVWAFGLGSLFHTAYQAFSLLWTGVSQFLAALLAIGVAQTLTVLRLHRMRLSARDFGGALKGWGAAVGVNLLGVLLTFLWLQTLPCRPAISDLAGLPHFLLSPTGWYLLWGVLPSLATALVYAGDMQPARD